jgi:hypothetical protein
MARAVESMQMGSSIVFNANSELYISVVSYMNFTWELCALSFLRDAANWLKIEFELGSSLTLQSGSQDGSFVIGINLIAIVVLVYVTRVVSRRRRRGAAAEQNRNCDSPKLNVHRN